MNNLANQLVENKPILKVIAKRKPRADAEKRFAELVSYIEGRIISEPVELDGIQWAGPIKQAELATELGMSISTLERYLGRPPIVRTSRGIAKGKATYLRLGAAGPDAPGAYPLRKIQNTMAKMWGEYIQSRTSPKEYGVICGLAEVWPPGWQVKIFKLMLTEPGWEMFAAAANQEIGVALMMRQHDADPFDPYLSDPIYDTARRMHGKTVFQRHYRFPCLPFLRSYHWVAATCFEEVMQGRNLGWSWAASGPDTDK